MNLYRSLLIFTLLKFLIYETLQYQQACSDGGASIQNLYSGIISLPYNDLNDGNINKNYFEQIGTGILTKDKHYAAAFSITGFEGSGRQQYYALMVKTYGLQNQNTRLSITMDFQYPNSNMLSIWTQIHLSYLIVSENLQKNGYSYVWVYVREFSLKNSIEGGIVQGDLFNHPNDKNLCGYDGRYWHTDGCEKLQAFPVYHCYLSGLKFNPGGLVGIYELAYSIQLLNKKGEIAVNEQQQNLNITFNKEKQAGPRVRINNFNGQMEKIKVSLIMSIIQGKKVSYPIGTFQMTYSGMYFYDKTWSSGKQIIQRQVQKNLYHYELPGIKYYIFGISQFIARKGLPRSASIQLLSEIQTQNSIDIQHNFKLPMRELIFSADFYYKRIDKICGEKFINIIEKNQVSQIKFQNYPSNDSSLIIRSVTDGNMLETDNQSVIEYLYYPSQSVQQTAWVTYTFSNIKIGGSYIFSLSINEIGNDGFADFTGYDFIVYANQHEIYKATMVGSPQNDKIQGIQKAININNNSIDVKIFTKIYRQENKNVNFRLNLLVKEIIKVFNPVTQCCNQVCPIHTGINITSTPIQCIICDAEKGFYFNEKYNSCMCKKGLYFIEDAIFPKCLSCQAGLCDMCEPKQPKKCIECILGAVLDPYYRTCQCLPQFIQIENKCFLNAQMKDVCLKYGYCDSNLFEAITFKPQPQKCIDGTFYNSAGSCSKCNIECLTCSNISSCISCDQKTNRILQNSICVCKEGYFPFQHQNKTRQCLKCAPQCLSCQFNSQYCTKCDAQRFMQKIITQKGSFSCECLPGYHPDGQGNCIESNCNFDKNCATCDQKLCTSCTKSSNRILKLPQHVCVCKEGFFENAKKQCQRCKNGCIKCISQNKCLSCVISAVNDNNGSCSCPQGRYYSLNIETNVGFCRKCLPVCESCSDQITCLTCRATFILSEQSKCICSLGQYLDLETLSCLKCSQGCAECSSSKSCKKCKTYLRLEESNCVYNCRMGFFSTQKDCFRCSQGCARCQSSQFCQQCSAGYILYQSQCYKQCPQGTLQSLNQSDCIPCNSPCKTCLYHPSQCLSCQNGKGYLQQIGDQIKCLNQCPLGMFPSNGACQLCDLNCLNCLAEKSNCIQCTSSQFLYKGKCYKQCPGVQYENICMNFCPVGYFRLQDKKCWPCSDKCLSCQKDRQICTSCRINFVLKDSQCIQKCNIDEFNDTGKCRKCSGLCKTCQGTPFNCTSCPESFFLTNGKCQNKCLSNQFFSYSLMKCNDCESPCKKCFSNYQCIACKLNYTLKEGICISACNYPCQNCFSKNQCKKCVAGFYLIEKQMQCTQYCPKGMRSQNGVCKCAYGFYFNRTCHIVCPYQTFSNQTQKTCQICQIQNCAECSAKNVCRRCEISFNYSKDKSECLRQNIQIDTEARCPNGLVYSKDKCVQICPQQYFNAITTSQNGSMCVYGLQSSRKISNQVNEKIYSSQKCLSNEQVVDGFCKPKCKIGYYLPQRAQQCKRCKETCLSCSDQSTCFLCINGFYLIENQCYSIKCSGSRKFYNGNCVNECPKGTFFDGEVCQKICPHNHYFSQGLCYLQCPSYSPYKLGFQCFQTCPIGYTAKGKQCV